MLVACLLAVSAAVGQTLPPQYVLNGKEVDLEDNVFIDPMNIKTMDVDKTYSTDEHYGRVFITTKEIPFPCYSLDDILDRYTDVSGGGDNIVYVVNGRVVNKAKGAIIDKSYFIYAEAKRLDKVGYISERYKDMIIVDIALEREEREKVTYIRGDKSPEKIIP